MPKECPDCGHHMPLRLFTVNKSEPDGRHYICKLCLQESKRPTVKTCRLCGEAKFLYRFYRNSRARDGLDSWCADCRSLLRQEKRDKVAAANRQLRMGNARRRREAIERLKKDSQS